MRYERRIVFTALLGSAPAAATALVLVFSGAFPMLVRCTVGAVLALSVLVSSYVLHRLLASRLLTLSKIIITALGIDDHWLREDTRSEVAAEVDALAMLLESQKVDAAEGTALLGTVLAQISARRPAPFIPGSVSPLAGIPSSPPRMELVQPQKNGQRNGGG